MDSLKRRHLLFLLPLKEAKVNRRVCVFVWSICTCGDIIWIDTLMGGGGCVFVGTSTLSQFRLKVSLKKNVCDKSKKGSRTRTNQTLVLMTETVIIHKH